MRYLLPLFFTSLSVCSVAMAQTDATRSTVHGVDLATGRAFRTTTADFSGDFQAFGAGTSDLFAVDFDATGNLLWGIGRDGNSALGAGPVGLHTGVLTRRFSLPITSLRVTDIATAGWRADMAPVWYVAEVSQDGTSTTLFAGDLSASELAPQFTLAGRIESIAVGRTGRILAHRADTQELLSIDPLTGTAGAVALDSRIVASMGFDRDVATGLLYASVRDQAGLTHFARIDPATGSAEFLAETTALGADLRFAIRRTERPVDVVRLCDPAVIHSGGGMAEMSAFGSLQIDRNDLVIEANDLPQSTFGIFLTSRDAMSAVMPPLSVGNLCLGGSIGRIFDGTGPFDSGALGRFRLPLDLAGLSQPTGAVAPEAFETWGFQAWFRDSAGGSATSNFSDVIQVQFGDGFEDPVFGDDDIWFGTAERIVATDANSSGVDEIFAAGRLGTYGGTLDRLYLSTLLPDGSLRFDVEPAYQTVNIFDFDVADFTGDGIADVVINTSTNPIGIRVVARSATGEYSEIFSDTLCNQPRLLDTGDIDGDGNQDMIVTCTSARAKVIFGLGGGAFGTPRSLFFDEDPIALDNADFDGDGRRDLAWVLDSIQEVEVRYALPNKQIGAPVRLPIGGEGTDVAAFDQNGDGLSDLVVSSASGNQLTYLQSLGGGGFAPGIPLFAGPTPSKIVADDIDQDGRVDLVVADVIDDAVFVFRNLGPGVFDTAVRVELGIAVQRMELGDFNGDGESDLVYGGEGSILMARYGLANDMMSVPPQTSMPNSTGILLAEDFDGDGVQDVLAIGNFAGTAHLYSGSGDGSLSTAIPIPSIERSLKGAVAADVDLDGDMDVVNLVAVPSTVEVSLNDGAGQFTTLPAFPVQGPLQDVAVGDMSGDGVPDYVVAEGLAGIRIYVGDGLGGFTSSTLSPPLFSANSVEIVDFDGDGWSDVLVRSGGVGFSARRIVRFNDRGTLSAPLSVAQGAGPIYAVDLDGDGLTDIAQSTVGGARIDGNMNLGNREFTTELLGGNQGNPGSLTLGSSAALHWADFDGDGSQDHVSAARTSTNDDFFALQLNNGHASSWEAQYQAIGGDAVLAVGDFDGDGTPDVVSASNEDLMLTVYLNRSR